MYASSKLITGASRMQITEVQDQAIQARMAFLVGAKTFDRLFAGIRFDEADGPLLYAYALNEEIATEIEDNFAPHIPVVAAQILKQPMRSWSCCRRFCSSRLVGRVSET